MIFEGVAEEEGIKTEIPLALAGVGIRFGR
jgi:hypothetical protein